MINVLIIDALLELLDFDSRYRSLAATAMMQIIQ
jgi:hypothetical protein